MKKYETTCFIADLKKAPRPRKLAEVHYRFNDDNMVENKDLTSRQLHTMLGQEFPTVEVSISMVK